MAKHKILFQLLLGILAFIQVSCSGNGSPYFATAPVDTYLRVSPESLTFEGTETKSFSIISNVDYWEITGCPDWLTLSSSSGKGNTTIMVVALENTTSAARTATLTIKSVAGSATVSITQEGNNDGRPGENDNQTPSAPARK